jgi:transcriptional regulator GlxA family with amidase domain
MPIDLEMVKHTISEDLASVRSISQLARRLDVSSEELRSDFITKEQISLSDYLTKIRVKVATTLLVESKAACKEICQEVGFSRADVGARAFKRLTGLTMGEFRRLAREDAPGSRFPIRNRAK